MPTANEEILRRQIAHQTYLQRYSTGVVQKMLSLLSQSERDVIDKLNVRLERILASGKDRGPFTSDRMLALLESIREGRKEAYAVLNDQSSEELTAFARYERDFQIAILSESIPVKLDIVSPSLETVRSATMSRPFQGRLLKNWIKDLDAKEFADVRRMIKFGIVEGETTQQIVSRVKGKLKTSRGNVETIVRSAISHVAQGARDEVGRANAQIIKAIQWVSTLDVGTTEHCRARDNKLYTLDHKPKGHKFPWGGGPGRIHPRCRSTQTFITKSWKELGVDLKEAPSGTRASMNGQVPDDLSYFEWLEKVGNTRDASGKTIAEVALGKRRGELFNQGKLKGADFNKSDGTAFTLKELERIEPRAFE